MPKQLKYNNIKTSFESEGYTLLTRCYLNNRQKLKYLCPNEHVHSISWINWQKGIRCPLCSGKVRLSISDVIDSFNDQGYTLLTTTYINNKQKLKYKCRRGHIHSISFHSWKQGHKCPVCARNIKYTYQQVKSLFANEGYTVLSSIYNNCKSRILYICPNKHKHSTNLDKWINSGRRCPTCAVINNCGPGNPNWKGGISFEPYCEVWRDKEYKKNIKNRDGNRCLNPTCSYKNPKDLVVHHIDYDKKNCGPSNLITLCRSCNSIANRNRDWHKGWYQLILKKRYNYGY